jgi:hypothetical protein
VSFSFFRRALKLLDLARIAGFTFCRSHHRLRSTQLLVSFSLQKIVKEGLTFFIFGLFFGAAPWAVLPRLNPSLDRNEATTNTSNRMSNKSGTPDPSRTQHLVAADATTQQKNQARCASPQPRFEKITQKMIWLHHLNFLNFLNSLLSLCSLLHNRIRAPSPFPQSIPIHSLNLTCNSQGFLPWSRTSSCSLEFSLHLILTLLS